jgi:hypothetical protein
MQLRLTSCAKQRQDTGWRQTFLQHSNPPPQSHRAYDSRQQWLLDLLLALVMD